MDRNILENQVGSKKIGFFHHAYFLLISQSSREGLTDFLFSEFGIDGQGNPDFHTWEGQHFYLEDAHALIREASMRALQEGVKKVFLIQADTLQREAQNALLKTIEEPSTDTIFFFFVSSEAVLLPTLRSRLLFVRLEADKIELEDSLFVQKFCSTPPNGRITLLSSIIEEKEKTKAITFLNNLEIYLRTSTSFTQEGEESLHIFDEIRKARGYLRDTAPSVKMLLEHICLSLAVEE